MLFKSFSHFSENNTLRLAAAEVIVLSKTMVCDPLAVPESPGS